jgi:dipeptidyl aminopeptidase/acylaminoacyl peptidase
MHGQDCAVFVVDVETKELIQLCHPERQQRVSTANKEILRSAQNDMPLNAHTPRWSPNGKRLAFHSDASGWFDVGMYDLDAKEISWVTNDEGDSKDACWSEDGQVIAYVKSSGAVNSIELCHTEGRSLSQNISTKDAVETLKSQETLLQSDIKKYQIGKGIHNGIRLVLSKVEGFTSSMKRMVTTFSSPSQPSDLWMVEVESGEAIQLTHSMPEDIPQDEFIAPEEIVYEGMDGIEVPALLFRPSQTPAPAVVMIHGGPNWHYAMEWNPVMAHFASRGFVVLCPNYRGSTGYGREWQYAARFDLGGVDTRDVAAGAQYLVREGLALENKIAVTGRSHGGYLTMTCLTQYSGLWRAGSAVVPFMNWFKTHENSREDVQHWDIENMGDPKENYERWHKASPYFFLERVTAPVQLICGGHDPRCPAEDSLEARDKLVELGKEVELLLYEDEGHAFLKIENVLDAELKRVEFLMKHLE